MVEHGTENAGVDSSILSLGTTPRKFCHFRGWISLFDGPYLSTTGPGFSKPAFISIAKAFAASFRLLVREYSTTLSRNFHKKGDWVNSDALGK